MEEFTESGSKHHELVILHTSEAQEWATYLQHTLKSSKRFRKFSILPFAVDTADQLHGNYLEHLESCKCIVLLLSGAFLDFLYESDQREVFQGVLYPPHRVVVLLCGVTEDDIPTDGLQGWQSWRKVFAEDEPAVYINTIWDSIADSKRKEAKHIVDENAPQQHTAEPAASKSDNTDVKECVASAVQQQTAARPQEPKDQVNPETEDVGASSQLGCLTVQPNRFLCGDTETLYVILTEKLDHQSIPELEFISKNGETTRIPATVENEYTLSVSAPDMPEGEVSLSMHIDIVRVNLGSVTYYTRMSEVSRILDSATDPVDFLCQAFNFSNKATESVDDMLTDSLKSRIPADSFHVFGNRQIEKDNMAAYQRDLELPTLLHFAAKYGLKKMMSALLQCPGALQAYSVMNKHGDYPNKLAEKSGFPDLRQFMDKFVETVQQSLSTEADGDEELYEPMSAPSQDVMMTEDIYESMLELNPECADDLYEVMNAVEENPEEALLRTFFQAKLECNTTKDKCELPRNGSKEKDEKQEEEEDPYNLFPEDIYDSVDTSTMYNQMIQNRPPAPIPRCESEPKIETYISRVFSDKSQRNSMEMNNIAARPFSLAPTSTYDPYSGMKTPGQRQLISLQERVKVGEITVNEAVQEFKAWSLDHERRALSVRYQQENLKRLRDSITRRHKEREKTGKDATDIEISAPIPGNMLWGMNTTPECAVYDPAPRQVALPPPATNTILRGSWKTGSTSSTSSTESNRLSTHSTISYSSGTEPDIEDSLENLPPPPVVRSLRRTEVPPAMPPPRIPPRVPERVPDVQVNERYVSYPTRALPHVASNRHSQTAPPLPRRLR